VNETLSINEQLQNSVVVFEKVNVEDEIFLGYQMCQLVKND
jgi:hypothetical protein